MSELKEPLASFHATGFDKEEFKKLVKALAQACGDSLEEGQFTTLMEALWPKIDQSIKSLKDELAETRRKNGKPEDAKPKVDLLLEEVVVRVREQGRLLATLAEQGGAGSGKEIIGAVQDIKMVQQHMMEELIKMDERRRFLRDREEDDLVRGDIRYSRKMNMKELDSILRKLPIEVVKSGPDAAFDMMMRAGLLHERMIELLGGRAATLEAIRFLVDRGTLGGSTKG